MDPHNKLEVTDKDGWRKEFLLQENIIHIGSGSRNDIVLEAWRGGGVATWHLQFIAGLGYKKGYRTINLGDADIPMGDSGDRVLPPRSTVDIANGECLRLGDFTLVFHLGKLEEEGRPEVVDSEGAPAAVAGGDISDVIGLSLSLPGSSLEPGHSLEGAVTVRNLGDRAGVQFKLAVEGLGPESYEVGSGPILFPDAEKKVFLRLHHSQGPHPLAGEHHVRIRVTAPEAYPGESATVSQAIQVLPFYRHTLRLVPPD